MSSAEMSQVGGKLVRVEGRQLVIEVNGSWHHDGELDVRRDQRRAAALTAAGFHVLLLPETLIRTASSEVVRIVIEARRRAARDLVRKATCS